MSRPGPANYTTNVNRAKTKKWVEAKSFSYDGDDWGDVDDYDEYGGYDEPEPEAAPKPTGLRQRGQSATQIPQEAYEARQDLYQSPVDSRQQYGNLSAPPPHQQQQQRNGARSFTNPQPQHHPALARTNSFDQEDEESAFSAGGPRQYGPSESFNSPSPQGQIVSALDSQPGRQFQDYPVRPHAAPGRPPISGPGRSSMEGQRRYGEQTQSAGANYRGGSYNDQARQSATGSRSQSMASNNSAMDFHNRRDFSPSAMPPPLQTRGSPSPHGPDLSSTSRPPRKSSLSQGGTPTQPFPTEASPTIRDQGEAVSPARDRAGSGAGKALPFVRPAEIYRRMQEEKEKERQSQDSSRPSMDAILGGPNDRPSLGRSQDSESSQRLKPTLDPVKERKSEYAIEGVNLQDQATPGEPRSMGAKTFEFPKRASNTGSHAPKSSLGPMLPDVSRVSGFGESFFGSTYEAGESSQDSFTGSPSPQPAPQFEKNAPVRNLQHQPSLGFTSAVHQAFDKAEDQVPPTPSSTQGSSVGRSTSGGTSTVSPIISRGPSTATENWNSRLPGIDSVSTPMIPEAAEGGSPRPLSSESLGTPTQITRKPSPSQHNVPPEAKEPPPSFIPGYRRSSDTPSLDNSPRRTPALETSRPLRQPQEIEIAAATPTDSSINASSGSQASEISPVENLGTEHIGEGSSHNPKAAPGRPTGYADTTISPISPAHDRFRGRTDSSSSSRVRNLADKFESGSRPGSAHSTTPRASVLGGNAQKKEDLPPPRPLADRMESFRPHLPGGWESSASIAPAAAFNNLQAPDVRQQVNQINSAPVHNSESPADTREMSEEKTTPTLDQQPSAVAQMKDASEEAFAAVAAAGSALAGAFGTAVGMEQHDSSPASTAEAPSNERVSQKGRGNDQSAIRSQGTLHPEASRPHMPAASDDETSTTAPTPLAQDPPRGLAAQQNEADDFSSPPMHQDVEESKSDADETKATKQPPALPLLSTDTRPQQYESDRLRKEIVRELIPMSASEPTTAETDYSNYQPTLSTNPSVSHPKHESGVLPKEYESYWNDAPSDDEVDQLNGSPDEVKDTTTPERQQDAAAVVSPLQPNQGHQRLPTASSSREEPPRGKSPMLPHRFSWEQPLHELPPQAEPAHEQPAATSSDFLKSAIYPDGHSRAQDEPPEDGSTLSPTTELDRIASESPRVSAKDSSVQGTNDLCGPEKRGLGNTKESPNFPSGLELVSSPTDSQPQAFPIAERERSLDNVPPPSPVVHNELRQESEPPRIGHPFQTSSDIPAPSLDLPPMPAPGNAQPKIPAFREILALKSPAERIRAYDETRAQFANLNTGLANWLVSTVNDLPQHNDLLVRAGQAAPNFQGHKPSPSRSKLGGLLPSGGQSNQQPYFQQYLNASPGAAPPDGKPAGGTIGGGPSQGFQPSGGSGGKLSGQQVQAKGKDLLHTAGVFGGKANVAAKGLFSKGKSKLRAASGNEKASPRQSSSNEPLSRGMHQSPPNPRAQISAEPSSDPYAYHVRAKYQGASPEPQTSSHSSQPRSPRDTPSVESFTQSQLGDDERSEESEPSSRTNPPRTSSLFLRHGQRDPKISQSVQHPVAIGDNAPIFLQETPSAESYIGSPKEIHAPRSTTSSNQTPTQATFTDPNLLATLPGRPDPVEQSISRQATREELAAYDGQRPRRLSSPQSRFSSPVPYSPNDRAATPTNRNALEMGSPQKPSSGDSKSTIRNVTGEKGLNESPGTSPKSSSLRNADLNLVSRAPARMNALAASEVSSTVTDAHRDGAKRPISSPVSSARDSLVVPRPSEDRSIRGPSIDSLPSRIDLDRPPSPVSPYQYSSREPPERRGRPGPIHYGLGHDFVPDSEHHNRSRSRSYSNARLSQDSHRPSIHEYSAFRGSSDASPHPYPGRSSRDHSPMLRQQAPDYQIEAVKSPIEWPSENQASEGRSRSRRGSRSSAFFKSLALGSSSKTEEPPLPNSPDDGVSSPPVDSPTPGDRKSKRSSVFRSLTGNSGSGSTSAQSKENVPPNGSKSERTQPVQSTPPPPPPQVEDDEFPSRGNSRSAASKFSKRLQRSSTSGNPGQESGKKKRFSGFGSLFGRGNPRRESSLNQSQGPPPREPPSTQRQQRNPNETAPPSAQQRRDPYETSPPSTQQQRSHYETISPPTQQQDWYKPPKDNYTPPPPGGYYAPRPAQVDEAPLPSNHRSQRHGPLSSGVPDPPAYIHNTALRQGLDPRMSPPAQTQDIAPARPSATFPQTSPQPSSSSVPRSSTVHSTSREPFSQRQRHESKSSGSTWTRFSQHGGSTSRQDQSRPTSNTTQKRSYQEPTSYPSLARTSKSYHVPSRSDSPPPPPPPPKDDWNRPRLQESTPSNVPSRSSQPTYSPSQTSPRPPSTQYRQSLPPLQTNVASKPRSAVTSGKTLTPEEKRRSRQQEIENATMKPQTPPNDGVRTGSRRVGDTEDEPVVMSATSFPGQEWQPDYLHWDGD